MADSKEPKAPKLTPPSDAPADAIERLVSRRQLQAERGDVLIVRELVPRVNPRPLSAEPQWRYRVCVHPDPQSCQTFTSFSHAASHAEHMAHAQRARLMFVEDDLPSLLADYRR